MVHERKVIEKVLQELEVGSIERGEAKSVKLARSPFERLGISRCENYFGSSALARRAVSRPMPALPPITTTV
jgi:hypothetical protein